MPLTGRKCVLKFIELKDEMISLLGPIEGTYLVDTWSENTLRGHVRERRYPEYSASLHVLKMPTYRLTGHARRAPPRAH